MPKNTVKEHFEECKSVSDVIDNANALLTKCQAELMVARDLLDGLKEYQHPKLTMSVPYRLRAKNDENLPPKALIDREIDRINALLGDRA
ncbi:hypothetical protein [Ruegeria sp. EL01]|uniref:hypothetical protein n=1 Tax=Ruegeria sp. EL01 TaxID=2107578 RepID=UPI000EA7F966|nr:hypothetical protein [Ruegeria sp. EL01]